MSGGNASPARVGLDSVRSSISAPDRRISARSCESRFGRVSQEKREENIASPDCNGHFRSMQWMPVAASLLTAFDNRSFIAHFCKKVLAPLCQFVVGNPQVYVERSNAFCTIKVHSEDRIMTKPIQNLIGQSGKLALLGTLA